MHILSETDISRYYISLPPVLHDNTRDPEGNSGTVKGTQIALAEDKPNNDKSEDDGEDYNDGCDVAGDVAVTYEEFFMIDPGRPSGNAKGLGIDDGDKDDGDDWDDWIEAAGNHAAQDDLALEGVDDNWLCISRKEEDDDAAPQPPGRAATEAINNPGIERRGRLCRIEDEDGTAARGSAGDASSVGVPATRAPLSRPDDGVNPSRDHSRRPELGKSSSADPTTVSGVLLVEGEGRVSRTEPAGCAIAHLKDVEAKLHPARHLYDRPGVRENWLRVLLPSPTKGVRPGNHHPVPSLRAVGNRVRSMSVASRRPGGGYRERKLDADTDTRKYRK